jgi:hypothetical protein
MAKEKTEAKTKEKPEKEAAPEFKYGVTDLAEILDIEPASVRVKLRNNEVEKAGKSYGWNTEKELKAIADLIRPKAKADKEEEKEEKPAKKAKK